MIGGIFHEGSGLGDQLFRYITVRTLAEKKGFDWGMMHSENFKGNSFIRDFSGTPLPYQGDTPFPLWEERAIWESRGGEWLDVRSYDPEINFVEDGTVLDGSFEDDKYWRDNLDNISKWLEVEPLEVPDYKCIVGFRGGEYATQPDLFLPASYYLAATKSIYDLYNVEKFQVHTDDPTLAKKLFSAFEVVENERISHSKHTNMGFNWRSARYAKYAIIPNSAFFILPRILKHHEDPTAITIAPRYWARRNKQVWARPACYYKEFTYI